MDTPPDIPGADAPEAATGNLERYLGNAIRDLRQRHGLTIAEVADQWAFALAHSEAAPQ